MKANEFTFKNDPRLSAKGTDHADLSPPAVDIYESDNVLTIVADLPGVTKEHLELGTHRNILTIEGHTNVTTDLNHRHREFKTTGYYRRFHLPENLDLGQTTAELKDGVLTLTLPKAAAAKPRRIEVTIH